MAVNKNAFFREMTLRICGSLDIDQAIEQAFRYLKQYIPADTLSLGYNNIDTEKKEPQKVCVLAKTACNGKSYIWLNEADEILLSEDAVEFLKNLPKDTPNALVFNRPEQQHPSMKAIYPGIKTNSAMFLRLIVKDVMTGALVVSSEGYDRYTPEHAHLLELIREPCAIAMMNARRYKELKHLKDLLAEDNRALAADIKRSIGVQVVGADFGLRTVMDQVRQIATSNSPALLLGETGTGKEVIANAIHMASHRSAGPMISMQCGGIPDTLMDSELFGHEKGAFTGAVEQKRGRFERAHGGTLFLDEIGELSLEAQVKLLRVLQEHKFERVGGVKTVGVDVRVIAATHRDLESMVKEGLFREDLWYRINVLPIRIPPLRLRREDIPSLVHYFIERKARELGLLVVPRVSSLDLERLQKYDWPGNVRELQNIVERALLLSKDEKVVFPDLTPIQVLSSVSGLFKTTETFLSMDEAMSAHIQTILEKTRWRVAGPGGAAEILKMNPSTLRFRMRKLGIK